MYLLIRPSVPQIRTLAYKILHSSTVLLPAWHAIVADLNLPPRVLPRDVRTRWNSTFQMLDVALKYRGAVDEITGHKKYDLLEYAVEEDEWTMAGQLRDVLKVRPSASTPNLHRPVTRDKLHTRTRSQTEHVRTHGPVSCLPVLMLSTALPRSAYALALTHVLVLALLRRHSILLSFWHA